MEKKVRFGDLVRKSGRPKVSTLWADPKKDREFNKAIRQNRVLTVVQEPTSKRKDYGRIGFHEERHASYLVFPRTLSKDAGLQVIGINYQLLDEPEPTQPARARAAKPAKPAPKRKAIAQAFRITIRRTATLDTEVEVRAATQKAAETEALKKVRAQPFELENAEAHEEIVKAA